MTIIARASTQRIESKTSGALVLPADLHDSARLRALIVRASPEICIHSAWSADPRTYLSSPENVAHLTAMLDLISALSSAGCTRFVGIGSCFEYACTKNPVSETSATKPWTLYGACKLAASHVGAQLAHTLDMSFAWCRLFWLYGPYEANARLVPSVVRGLLRGETVPTTDGRQLRDFLHVADVASAIGAVSLSGLEGVVNIGSGEPVRVREVLDTLRLSIGGAGEFRPGARQARIGDPPAVWAETSKLRALGWAPTWSLEEGLRNTVEWWRAILK